MRSGIYKFTNLINGKVYIGSSSRVEKRAGDHIHSGKRGSKLLFRAIIKYGIDNFKMEVIESINISNYPDRRTFWLYMYEREQAHLDSYFAKEYITSSGKDNRFLKLTYNLNPKAAGCGGKKQTKEHIEKRVKWWKNKEWREKVCKKLRESASKFDHTKPTGIKPSQETINKCMETKLKKGSVKPIIAIDKIDSSKIVGPFPGYASCGKALGIDDAAIRECLLHIGTRKTAKGYKFKFINLEEYEKSKS